MQANESMGMEEIIKKVLELEENTKGRFTSFPAMLESVAQFQRELPDLIDSLHDIKSYYDDLERENIELQRQIRGVRIA